MIVTCACSNGGCVFVYNKLVESLIRTTVLVATTIGVYVVPPPSPPPFNQEQNRVLAKSALMPH